MPILEFQCHDCSAVFDQFISPNLRLEISCVSCGQKRVSRVISTYFYPNKTFCPHDKNLNAEKLQDELSGIMKDKSLQCGGCGTDGAAGNCGSKGGGCSCGKGGCSTSSKASSCRISTNFASLL